MNWQDYIYITTSIITAAFFLGSAVAIIIVLCFVHKIEIEILQKMRRLNKLKSERKIPTSNISLFSSFGFYDSLVEELSGEIKILEKKREFLLGRIPFLSLFKKCS